jgi:hypothetical protein
VVVRDLERRTIHGGQHVIVLIGKRGVEEVYNARIVVYD